jgi:hypothetical protein
MTDKKYSSVKTQLSSSSSGSSSLSTPKFTSFSVCNVPPTQQHTLTRRTLAFLMGFHLKPIIVDNTSIENADTDSKKLSESNTRLIIRSSTQESSVLSDTVNLVQVSEPESDASTLSELLTPTLPRPDHKAPTMVRTNTANVVESGCDDGSEIANTTAAVVGASNPDIDGESDAAASHSDSDSAAAADCNSTIASPPPIRRSFLFNPIFDVCIILHFASMP